MLIQSLQDKNYKHTPRKPEFERKRKKMNKDRKLLYYMNWLQDMDSDAFTYLERTCYTEMMKSSLLWIDKRTWTKKMQRRASKCTWHFEHEDWGEELLDDTERDPNFAWIDSLVFDRQIISQGHKQRMITLYTPYLRHYGLGPPDPSSRIPAHRIRRFVSDQPNIFGIPSGQGYCIDNINHYQEKTKIKMSAENHIFHSFPSRKENLRFTDLKTRKIKKTRYRDHHCNLSNIFFENKDPSKDTLIKICNDNKISISKNMTKSVIFNKLMKSRHDNRMFDPSGYGRWLVGYPKSYCEV